MFYNNSKEIMRIIQVGDKIYNFDRKETVVRICKSTSNPSILRYYTVTENGSPNMFTSQDLCIEAKGRIRLIK